MSLENHYQHLIYKCLPYLLYAPKTDQFREEIIGKLQTLFRFMYLDDKLGYYVLEESINHMLNAPPLYVPGIKDNIQRFINTYSSMGEQIADIQSRLYALEKPSSSRRGRLWTDEENKALIDTIPQGIDACRNHPLLSDRTKNAIEEHYAHLKKTRIEEIGEDKKIKEEHKVAPIETYPQKDTKMVPHCICRKKLSRYGSNKAGQQVWVCDKRRGGCGRSYIEDKDGRPYRSIEKIFALIPDKRS